jgi:regulatory protein YycI of two-component signal transduction system YycFG
MMKSKKVAFILVYSLIAMFGVVIAVNWYSISQGEETIEEYLEEEEAVEVITVSHEEGGEESDLSNDEETESGAGEIIATVHQELNQLVGWNRYRGFSWGRNEPRLEGIVEDLETMLEIDTNDDRRKDAKRTIQAIQKALDGSDVEGVRLAHKIMHDLDFYVNGNVGDGKRYGITEYQ